MADYANCAKNWITLYYRFTHEKFFAEKLSCWKESRYLAYDLENCFHFHSGTCGQCREAKGTAGVVAVALLAVNLMEQIGGAVDDKVLIGEVRRGIDTAE